MVTPHPNQRGGGGGGGGGGGKHQMHTLVFFAQLMTVASEQKGHELTPGHVIIA